MRLHIAMLTDALISECQIVVALVARYISGKHKAFAGTLGSSSFESFHKPSSRFADLFLYLQPTSSISEALPELRPWRGLYWDAALLKGYPSYKDWWMPTG